MKSAKWYCALVAPIWLLLIFGMPMTLPAADPVVGVNIENADRLSAAQQDAILSALRAAGVRVVRAGLAPEDENQLNFARKLYAAGIHIDFLFGFYPNYKAGAPVRPANPKWPWFWSGVPLSYADPDRFRIYFTARLAKFEEAGITLAALEPANEINMAAFNAEFPIPGQGKQFGLNDLAHDPEAQQIAKGYLQYLRMLAVVKDVRDHSKLNRQTPILTAGFGAYEAPEGVIDTNNTGPKTDMVSVNATIDFMRAHGLDQLVDAYAIHVYPWNNGPGEQAAAEGRRDRLAKYVLTKCRPAGSADGKPCWITEWGFANTDMNCPIDDTNRAALVREMMGNFRPYVQQGRLTGLIYYAWNTDPWQKKTDALTVYRCGALTESGRLALALESPPKANPCPECRIRVGLPRIVRGPTWDIADSSFTEIQLPSGRFRGFTSAAHTTVIDGDRPWDMGGPGVMVLKPGPPGSPAVCGQWLQHVELVGKTLLGWVHQEMACDYKKNGQTHASMSLAVSADYGLTWNSKGLIITGTDKPTSWRQTGDSGASIFDGKDGFYYLYGPRHREQGQTFVARAPVSDPGPGHWVKYYNGAWSEPGLGGEISPLKAGLTSARWVTTGETVNLRGVPGGLGLGLSQDHVNFKVLPEPLLIVDPATWARPAPDELVAYWSLLDARTGANQLGDEWNLFYMDIQPNEGADKRCLVFRPIEVSRSRQPSEPQVGVMLGRWYNAKLHDRWSTTGVVPGNYEAYQLETKLGYLLTAPDETKATVELEDRVSQWPGHPDHLLEEAPRYDPNDHFQRLRIAGWAYSQPQEGTIPLYRCYDPQEKSHFVSNRSDCEKLGTMERLLGYALSQ